MKNGEQKNQDCKLILTRVKSRLDDPLYTSLAT